MRRVVIGLLLVAVILGIMISVQMAASDKVTICHKGKNTLSVDSSAVPAHIGHGDTMGACGVSPNK